MGAFPLILVLGAVFLVMALEVVEAKNTEFGGLFVTNLIGVVLNYTPVVGCIFYWLTIDNRHETGWAGAIVAWLVACLIPVLMLSVLFFLFVLPGFIAFWPL